MSINTGHTYSVLNLSLPQALRDAQLSATKLHASARGEIRRTSSTSAGLPQTIPAPQPGIDAASNQVMAELKEIAKRLFVLCSPWPMWKVSGSLFITELPSDANQDQPALGDIIENDEIGDRILSFVPQQLRVSFLSLSGQRLVSRHFSLDSLLNSYPDINNYRLGRQ